MTYNRFRKNTEDIDGLEGYATLRTGRNSGIGARLEGETLAPAGNTAWNALTFKTKTLTARVQFTTQSIDLTRTDKGSAFRAVPTELESTADAAKRDLNRQIFGTSNGVLATCGTTTASTTVQLAATTPVSIMRFFEVGMVVDVGTVATPTSIATSRRITGVDRVNKTIAIADGGPAITTTSAAFVFRQGNGGAGTAQHEVTGLQTLVNNTGAYFSLDPSTLPIWASTVLSNSGTPRAASELLFTQAIDDVHVESGSRLNLFVTTYGVMRNYAAQLVAQHLYNDMNMQRDGGFDGIRIHSSSGTVEAVPDRDCPDGTAFGLSTDKINQYVARDWAWDDRTGSVLTPITGQLAYEAKLYSQIEFASWARNAHAKISDLLETNVAA